MRHLLIAVLTLAVLAGCKKKEIDNADKIEIIEEDEVKPPPEQAVIPADPTVEIVEEAKEKTSVPDAAVTKLVAVMDGRKKIAEVSFGVTPDEVTITSVAAEGLSLKQVDTCIRLRNTEGRVVTDGNCLYNETRFMAPGSRDAVMTVPKSFFGNGVPAKPTKRTAFFLVQLITETDGKTPQQHRGAADLEIELP